MFIRGERENRTFTDASYKERTSKLIFLISAAPPADQKMIAK
jgi:hypothetical protein